MKNLTKFGMMLLAAALCVGMSSCSDDDDKEVGVGGSLSFASNNPLISKGKKLLTKIVTESDYDDESYSFMYDSHFRPIKITNESGTWGENTYIDYETGIIYDDEEADGKITFTPQGYIKGYSYSWSGEYGGYKEGNTSCTYNSEGHLTKTEWTDQWREENESGTDFGVVSLVWKDGNMVKATYSWKETWNGGKDEETSYSTIEYSYLDNIFRQFPSGFMQVVDLVDDVIASVGLLGIGPKKLPKKIVWDNGETYTFEYILNADGSIRQETVTKNGDSDGYNYTKTYSYSYTPIE